MKRGIEKRMGKMFGKMEREKIFLVISQFLMTIKSFEKKENGFYNTMNTPNHTILFVHYPNYEYGKKTRERSETSF